MSGPNPFIRLDPRDNVVVARMDVAAGTVAPGEGVAAREAVPAGHKIATRALRKGEPILKYNTVIGFAAADVQAGTRMHSHNIAFGEVLKDYRFCADYRPAERFEPGQRARFDGIVRSDGRVATRNYVGIFVVGNGVATVARRIARAFPNARLAGWPNVDGVVPFVHEGGTGIEASGEGLEVLRRTLGGYVRHPNVGAALVIARGDEQSALEAFLAHQGLERDARLATLVMEEAGGTRRAIEAGVAVVQRLLAHANDARRRPVSAEHLVVGLQCGGSDGFSGLSANPALGAAMDILVRHGGSAILSETTEIYGVEQTLTARAVSEGVGRRLVERMQWWLAHGKGRDIQINGNVSPGNNAGGISNVLEKSLGGAKKGGSSPLMAVYEYAEPVTEHGLVFMDTPGYDPVSATGQIAGGANLIAFTTGRGSCFGSYPAPTMKLATNTPMYERMRSDMDLNCGPIIDGVATIEQVGARIFEQLLRHASGAATKSEAIGVGEDEFVPWPLAALT